MTELATFCQLCIKRVGSIDGETPPEKRRAKAAAAKADKDGGEPAEVASAYYVTIRSGPSAREQSQRGRLNLTYSHTAETVEAWIVKIAGEFTRARWATVAELRERPAGTVLDKVELVPPDDVEISSSYPEGGAGNLIGAVVATNSMLRTANADLLAGVGDAFALITDLANKVGRTEGYNDAIKSVSAVHERAAMYGAVGRAVDSMAPHLPALVLALATGGVAADGLADAPRRDQLLAILTSSATGLGTLLKAEPKLLEPSVRERLRDLVSAIGSMPALGITVTLD